LAQVPGCEVTGAGYCFLTSDVHGAGPMSRSRAQEEDLSMQHYRCPKCGADAYTSARAAKVLCPKCAAPLTNAVADEAAAGSPTSC